MYHSALFVLLAGVSASLAVPTLQEDDPSTVVFFEQPDELLTLRSYGPFLEYLNPFSWFEDDYEDKNSTEANLSKDDVLYSIVKCLVLEHGEKCKDLLKAAEKIFEEKDDSGESQPGTNQTESTTKKPPKPTKGSQTDQPGTNQTTETNQSGTNQTDTNQSGTNQTDTNQSQTNQTRKSLLESS